MDLNKALLFLGGLSTVGVGTVANADSLQYNVESGDTLSKIALDHNVSLDKIVNDNNISDPNMIYVGDVLTINTDDNVNSVNQTSQPVQSYDSYNVPTVEQSYPVESQQNSQESYIDYSNDYSNQSQYTVEPETNNVVAPVQNVESNTSYNSGDESAKEWIAQRESGGSYSAQNGRYIGRYQLDSAYLGGDYSPENQERVANQYVTGRYGSWQAAKDFWIANGWY